MRNTKNTTKRRLINNIRRINPQNCGDTNCSPLKYFDLHTSYRELCIEKITNAPYLLSFIKESGCSTIIGGGGLVYYGWLHVLRNLPKESIVWGIGLNLHGKRENGTYPSFFDFFKLVGVRDFGTKYRWVPCASCMHPFFSKIPPPSRDVVVYEHYEQPIALPQGCDFPRLNNGVRDMVTALKFIASGSTVITNTYHGVYWATLLGRRVVALPIWDSSRFFFFKHPPLIVNEFSLKDLNKTIRYDESLGECVNSNEKFHEDVSNSL